MAQTQVERLGKSNTDEGVVYTLPRTALHIVATSIKTSYTPGPLAAWAKPLLRTDVSLQPSETYTLDDINIEPYGVPDTAQVYAVRLKARTSAPLISLSNEGILSAINAQPRPTAPLTQPSSTIFYNEADSLPDQRSVATPEMLQATNQRSMAEIAVREIYDIRTSRALLSKGQADFMPKDGEQLRLMLQNLNERENALLSLFCGSVKKERIVSCTDAIVDSVNTDIIFARFSSYQGFLLKDDLSGTPLHLIAKPEATPAVRLPENGSKQSANSIVYRLPAPTRLIVEHNGKVLKEFSTPIAQYGTLAYLGPELFNKRADTHIVFSTTTGAIQTISDK